MKCKEGTKAHYDLILQVLRSLMVLIRETEQGVYGYYNGWRIEYDIYLYSTRWRVYYTGERCNPSYAKTLQWLKSHYGRNPTASVNIDEKTKQVHIAELKELMTVVKIIKTPYIKI